MARRRPTSCLSLLAALALALFAGAPTSWACTCGVERWSVKTGTDPDAGLVDLTRSTAATISYLASLPAPASLPDNGRVQPTETTQFLLDVLLTAYKREDDCDYHLIIDDTAGNMMIVEIPDPACVASTSLFATAIAHARAQFDARLVATTSWKMPTPPIPILVQGVGFFDVLHGQTGAAPNGIELHPVTDITFDPPPCGDVNGDGVVNIGDALLVAQFDVGLRQCRVAPFVHPERCDLNGDGACDIGDALRIAQCDVGLVGCAFTCGPFACPSTTTTTVSPPTTTTTTTIPIPPCTTLGSSCGSCVGGGVCVQLCGHSCTLGCLAIQGNTGATCTSDGQCPPGKVCATNPNLCPADCGRTLAGVCAFPCP